MKDILDVERGTAIVREACFHGVRDGGSGAGVRHDAPGPTRPISGSWVDCQAMPNCRSMYW